MITFPLHKQNISFVPVMARIFSL